MVVGQVPFRLRRFEAPAPGVPIDGGQPWKPHAGGVGGRHCCRR